MRKTIVILLTLLVLLPSLCLAAGAASPSPVITVGDVSGKVGDTVTTVVSIDCASADYLGFATISIQIEYDDAALELTAADNSISSGMFVSAQALDTNPYNAIWLSATANCKKGGNGYTGEMMSLTFKMLKSGTHEIKVASYLGADGKDVDGEDCNYYYEEDASGKIIMDDNFITNDIALGTVYKSGKITATGTDIATTTKAPATTTKAPATTTKAPAETTQAPVTTAAPATTAAPTTTEPPVSIDVTNIPVITNTPATTAQDAQTAAPFTSDGGTAVAAIALAAAALAITLILAKRHRIK